MSLLRIEAKTEKQPTQIWQVQADLVVSGQTCLGGGGEG